MRVMAYCCQSFKRAVKRAAGVEPITCPPLDANMIDTRDLEGYDLLYLDLHGQPDDTAWYGDDQDVALTCEQVEKMNLRGTVVFAANCYLGDENAPMMAALMQAGAKCVIAAPGKNYGGKKNLTGSSSLGHWFRVFFGLKKDPDWALKTAKNALKAERAASSISGSKKLSDAIDDTLEFRAFGLEQEHA
jgi:hypothetical protein